ncbi:hypothetical protein MMC07_003881 [Pseudocyphellaria aurata]|nr:hypothetical protein [Pseudocyphellaria aurata]
MPTSRLVLLLICLLVLPTFLTFFSLLYSHPQGRAGTDTLDPISRSGLRAFFSFHTPSSLFPSSAIISLTDDNSTFFLARPADFGSTLPAKGLSGQLWVGSGFGDDGLGRGGLIAVAEGELGCSDVPGWEDGNRHNHGEIGMLATHSTEASKTNKVFGSTAGSEGTEFSSAADEMEDTSSEDDGTDDYLHHPLSRSTVSKPVRPGESARDEFNKNGAPPAHADIQSLQESAEIAGKVVLLSRGGCGFLEKAKWVQRRGGTALIVGDDTRGGELLTMYARGDTSNVTIPSLFTSHTTAHLLSSLIPAGGSGGGFLLGDKWRLTPGQGRAGNVGTTEKKNPADFLDGDRPTFTMSSDLAKSTHLSHSSRRFKAGKRSLSKQNSALKQDEHKSWFTLLTFSLGISRKSLNPNLSADSRRPPSSGRLNWVSEKWEDESQKGKKVALKNDAGSKIQPSSKVGSKSATPQPSSDEFVIGVQDWRDPDLVIAESSRDTNKYNPDGKGNNIKASDHNDGTASDASPKDVENSLTGGIITPGSGEYGKSSSNHHETESNTSDQDRKGTDKDGTNQSVGDSRTGSDQQLTGQGRDIPSFVSGGTGREKSYQNKDHKAQMSQTESWNDGDKSFERHQPEMREGLWVTLTPTTMTTSPFFDTLLVLVVSPIVTLTVVYALLLLRSRIRRRRWRAPKSVVDRLPVRTYHTMSCSSTSSSPRLASPKNSSPTTPLLQSNPHSTLAYPRPRSRTTSGIDESQPISLSKAATKASLGSHGKNPRPQAFPKKYTAKQIECVVCLEEYVDGHSRVMSLPCGHEFHAECITPWLTTRRRTCPICKGDVVRSMARCSSNAATADSRFQYEDSPVTDTDDIQAQAAETINDSPSSAIPIPCDHHDLEGGEDDLAATLVNDDNGRELSSPRRGWRDLASLSLSAFSGEAAWRQAQADRNR